MARVTKVLCQWLSPWSSSKQRWAAAVLLSTLFDFQLVATNRTSAPRPCMDQWPSDVCHLTVILTIIVTIDHLLFYCCYYLNCKHLHFHLNVPWSGFSCWMANVLICCSNGCINSFIALSKYSIIDFGSLTISLCLPFHGTPLLFLAVSSWCFHGILQTANNVTS